ncbi:hypothetical protein LIP_0042 [Limnochorda pilosa]|uniref:Uncharacterized protein n=1 Tax=Limnochorda pilosa TaxID=1555112 RepID=A0A0K2SFN3_LIMPI|nr:hypothetical protein LIP_0042 [Limnochorda pilosa]
MRRWRAELAWLTLLAALRGILLPTYRRSLPGVESAEFEPVDAPAPVPGVAADDLLAHPLERAWKAALRYRHASLQTGHRSLASLLNSTEKSSSSP